MWWALVTVGLIGCGATGAETAAPVDPVLEHSSRGPHGVGYRATEVVYPDPAGVGERRLRLALWYPSDASSGTPVDKYNVLFPAEEDVWEEPEVAAGGELPVLLFSHGSQAYAEASAFLCSHFASHGWLVASADHTGNTTFDDPERNTPIYLQRPLDVSAVLNHLLALPASDPLAGRASDRVVAMGHSFGGYTMHALAGASYDVQGACAADPEGNFCREMNPEYEAAFAVGLADERIAALGSLAPGDLDKFGAQGLGRIDRPVFHMVGSLDNPEGADEIWAALQGGDSLQLEILQGGHNVFTDLSGMVESVEGELIDPEEGWRITRAYALAFARQHTGDPAGQALLSGELEVSASAVLSR